MDIDATNFWQTLPKVLEAISKADYVSVDLEMTGVRIKQLARPSTRPSLQQIYQEARDGAEAFQVLEVGLTCIRWDDEVEAYWTESYNFAITPLFLADNNAAVFLARVVDRRVTFSYSTFLFLQRFGFQFDKVFAGGTPYLSRDEADAIHTELFDHDPESARKPIQLHRHGKETHEFYAYVRKEIQGWVDQPTLGDYVNIENPNGGKLNRFQIRLVHELVATDFPAYRAVTKLGGVFMQVAKVNAKEEQFFQGQKAERKRAVIKQTGFRFVIDALCGVPFATVIDAELIVTAADCEPKRMMQTRREIQKTLDECERRLLKKCPVLVGHNLLSDLCFIYDAFIGRLPEKVEDFHAKINELFPRIVDTKYLFTRGCHEMSSDETLEECYQSVKRETQPPIRHLPGYGYNAAKLHEAGYDSYITAVVFIRMSYKVAGSKAKLELVETDDWDETPAQASPVQASPVQASSGPVTQGAFDAAAVVSRVGTRNPYGVLAPPTPRIGSPASRVAISNYLIGSFSTRTLLDQEDEDFELLQDEPLLPINRPCTPPTWPNIPLAGPPGSSHASSSLHAAIGPPIDDGPGSVNPLSHTNKPPHRDASASVSVPTEEENGRVPDWDTVFWKRFGNKIRFGQAGIMHLGFPFRG